MRCHLETLIAFFDDFFLSITSKTKKKGFEIQEHDVKKLPRIHKNVMDHYKAENVYFSLTSINYYELIIKSTPFTLS